LKLHTSYFSPDVIRMKTSVLYGSCWFLSAFIISWDKRTRYFKLLYFATFNTKWILWQSNAVNIAGVYIICISYTVNVNQYIILPCCFCCYKFCGAALSLLAVQSQYVFKYIHILVSLIWHTFYTVNVIIKPLPVSR